MLGYLTVTGHGAADRLLAEVAARLAGRGVPLAGAVQVNEPNPRGGPWIMSLEALSGRARIRISQDLGPHARGCRLDPDGLERAVALAEAALAGPVLPRLLIVNKFGKQEAEGRGFRPVIGQALGLGVPVLLAVGETNLPAFKRFAEDMAEPVAATPQAALDWAERALSEAV